MNGLRKMLQDFPWMFGSACFGVTVGIMGYTFIYAKGFSYLSNDPKACVNCHIMTEQYEGWMKSPHHAVATCNDCHTPSGLIGKYTTKALNGFWHSYYFTTGTFVDPIRINARNARIANESCLKCHSDLVHGISNPKPHHRGETLTCARCHGAVGHSRQ